MDEQALQQAPLLIHGCGLAKAASAGRPSSDVSLPSSATRSRVAARVVDQAPHTHTHTSDRVLAIYAGKLRAKTTIAVPRFVWVTWGLTIPTRKAQT